METRYDMPLDWPLFVELTNQCYNPESDYVRADNPELAECVRTCFPPGQNNDVTRLICAHTSCYEIINECFDIVVKHYYRYTMEQTEKEEDPNYQEEDEEEQHVLEHPIDYANVVNNPGQCCNETYVTVTREQVANQADTYAGSPFRASDSLNLCGFVKLEGLIDRDVALAASLAVNETLVNYTYFDDYYMALEEFGLEVDDDDEDSEDSQDGSGDEPDEEEPIVLQSRDEVVHYDLSDIEHLTLGQLKEWHEEEVVALAKATEEGRAVTDRDSKYHKSPGLDNLRAGRFESIVPPFRNEFDNLLKALHDNPMVTPVLNNVWPVPEKPDMPENKEQGRINENLEEDPGYHLLYANILSQTIHGLNSAEGQRRHRDSETCEDIKVQISIHDYTREDGGTYFQPGTHCYGPDIYDNFDQLFHSGLHVDLEHHKTHGVPSDICTGFAPTSMGAGDVIMYYAGTAHGGSSNFSGRRRSFIDVVMHSSHQKGRLYHSSERNDRPYGTFDDKLVKMACAQAEMEKQMGMSQPPKSVDDMDYGEQPLSAEWLCKVTTNIVKAVEHQRAVFHGYDETVDKKHSKKFAAANDNIEEL